MTYPRLVWQYPFDLAEIGTAHQKDGVDVVFSLPRKLSRPVNVMAPLSGELTIQRTEDGRLAELNIVTSVNGTVVTNRIIGDGRAMSSLKQSSDESRQVKRGEVIAFIDPVFQLPGVKTKIEWTATLVPAPAGRAIGDIAINPLDAAKLMGGIQMFGQGPQFPEVLPASVPAPTAVPTKSSGGLGMILIAGLAGYFFLKKKKKK